MREKDGQADQTECGFPGFKRSQSILEPLCTRFGTRHNTVYDMQELASLLQFMLSLVLANIGVGLRREVGRQAHDVTPIGLLSMMVNYYAMSLHKEWPPPG